jgi:hypothetical protein
MKAGIRTKLLLIFSIALFLLFLAGVSDWGQRYLIGTPPTDHWVADDRAMGAGLAPYAYCLLPAILLLMGTGTSYVADRRKKGSN